MPRLQLGARFDRHEDRTAFRLDADEIVRCEAAARKVGRMQRELRLSRMGEELRDGAGAAHAVPLISATGKYGAATNRARPSTVGYTPSP